MSATKTPDNRPEWAPETTITAPADLEAVRLKKLGYTGFRPEPSLRSGLRLHIGPMFVQVLTPMRVGPAGYLLFNDIIQSIVNPDGERVEIAGQVFRMNDRVMQTVNDYKLDIFNGDVGFIKSVSMEDKVMEIDFFDQTVLYPFGSLSNLTLSYASSVHKAQGSEFKAVILILLSHHWVMLDRNIIYTANTRARKMAIYLASRTAIETAVRTQKVLKRNSLLALRLRASVPKLEEQAA